MTKKSKIKTILSNRLNILIAIAAFGITSCVSINNFKFDNQKTYNYTIELPPDSSSIARIKDWFLYSFPIDKTNNDIINESENTLLINCDTRLNYPAPVPYEINYPTIFKTEILLTSDKINVQFYDYMILNYPKSHVINKQFKQHKIDAYFDSIFQQLKSSLTEEQEKTAQNTLE